MAKQFQPPPCPGNWNAQERQFYNALIGILDDLYSSRLAESELSREVQNKLNAAYNGIVKIIYSDTEPEYEDGALWLEPVEPAVNP